MMKAARKGFATSINASGNYIQDMKGEMVVFCDEMLTAVSKNIWPNLKHLLRMMAMGYNKPVQRSP